MENKLKEEQQMTRTEKIMNEENPYLREIWAAGYDRVFEDVCMDNIELIAIDPPVRKVISMFDYRQCIGSLKIIKASTYSGKRCDWISDADGSGDKFRELIGKAKDAPEEPDNDDLMCFHECPNCNIRCNCSHNPCKCCEVEMENPALTTYLNDKYSIMSEEEFRTKFELMDVNNYDLYVEFQNKDRSIASQAWEERGNQLVGNPDILKKIEAIKSDIKVCMEDFDRQGEPTSEYPPGTVHTDISKSEVYHRGRLSGAEEILKKLEFPTPIEEAEKQKKDYRQRYDKIVKSEWFINAYRNKPLGGEELDFLHECMRENIPKTPTLPGRDKEQGKEKACCGKFTSCEFCDGRIG